MERNRFNAMLRVLVISLLSVVLMPANLGAQDKEWFTVVLFGDPEIGMGGDDRPTNNCNNTTITKWFNGIIGMGKSGGLNFSFYNAPDSYVPQANLVICMGDMDADSQTSKNSDLETAFDKFNDNSIPFVTMLGNHDKVPDYWNGGDLGPTYGKRGGGAADEYAIGLTTTYFNKDANNVFANKTTYTPSSGEVKIKPFAFTYNGVRFYIGQTYWFQKSYDKQTFWQYLASTAPKHYAPNDVITQLTTDVGTYAEYPSVWVQHFPIGCADRWWNEQNANGATISPSNTATYATAAEKRTKYKELIASTKNPQHFSGHNHTQSKTSYTENGKTFYDYVAPYFAECGGAFIALCNNVDGVVEVRAVNFDNDDQRYNTVNGLTHLSNDKVYAIHSNGRGNLRQKGANTYVTAINGDTFDFSDNCQQWAILTYDGKRYLFNRGVRKFASRNGTRLDLVDVPGTNAETTIGYIDNTMNYPWTFLFGSDHLNLNSTTDGYVVNSYSTLDDGNQLAITEIGNFSERSSVLVEGLTLQVVDKSTLEVISSVTLPMAAVGANVQSITSMPVGYVFDSASAMTVTAGVHSYTIYVKAAIPLEDITTGWYQIVVGANNMAAYVNNYLRTHETGVARSNGTYDVTMSTNQTDLSTLFYVEKNGDGTDANYPYTIRNQTGYYWDGAGSRLGTSTSFPSWKKLKFAEPATADIHIQSTTHLMVFEEGTTPLVGAGSLMTTTRWNFLSGAELLDGLDVYTVEYNNDVSSSVTVTYDNASYTGIRTVVNGGVFFLGTIPTSSDFSCTNDAVVVVDATNKKLIVAADAIEAARTVCNMRGVGYPKTTSAEYIALVNRLSEYDTVKGGGSVTPDYSTNYDAKTNKKSDRYTDYVKITIGENSQQISVGQRQGSPIYYDKTSETFTCNPGDVITPYIVYVGGNMNKYVYIDENKNGFSATNDDFNGNVLKTGSDIDLKAFSRYNINGTNVNSLGATVGASEGTLPSFTAPTSPGNYRIRFKVDWGSIDPAGRNDGNNYTDNNGGSIVDVTLIVGTIDPIYITNVQTALAAYYNCTDIEMPQDGQYYNVARIDEESQSYLVKDNGDATYRLIGPEAKYSNGTGYTDTYSAVNNLTVSKYGSGEINFGRVSLGVATNATYWRSVAAPTPITPIYGGGAGRTIIMTLPGINTSHVAVYIDDTKQTAPVTPGEDTRVVLPDVPSGTIFTIFVGDGNIVRQISYTRPDAYFVTVHHRIYGSGTDDFGTMIEEVDALSASAWSPQRVTVPAGYSVHGGTWPLKDIISEDLSELIIEYDFSEANMPIQATVMGADGYPTTAHYYTMTINGKDAYFNFTTSSGVTSNHIKLTSRGERDVFDYFYFVGNNSEGYTIHSTAVSPGLSYDVRTTKFTVAENKYILLDTYDGSTHKYVFREVGSSALINETNGSDGLLSIWDITPDVTAAKALFTFVSADAAAAAAIDALSLPQADRYYYVKNCNSNFTSTKTLWLDWGVPKWKDIVNTDLCHLWEMIPAEGGYAMRNMGCKTYLQNKTTSSADQSVSYLFLLQSTPNVQFCIATSAGEGLHANNHGGTTPNASGDTNVNWYAIANSPSAWQIVEPTADDYTAISNYWTTFVAGRYTDDWLTSTECASRDDAMLNIAGDGIKSSSNLQTLISTLATIDTPKTNHFYRIKGNTGNYVSSMTYNNQGDGGYYLMSANNEANKFNIIWYYGNDRTFVGYKNGKGMKNTYMQAGVSEARNTFTFTTEMFARPQLAMKTDFVDSPYTYDATTLFSRDITIRTSNQLLYGWIFEPVTALPVAITSVGYATFYTPVTVTVPDGVKAYVCTKSGSSLEMTSVSTISAGQGVILKGAEGTYDFPIEGEDNGHECALSGLTASAYSNTGDYVLSIGTIGGQSDQVGFFPVRTNEILSAFKSYLSNGDAQYISAFSFSFDEIATAIEAADNQSLQEGVTYNLSGQRVQRTKGVVIVNGKKIVIK